MIQVHGQDHGAVRVAEVTVNVLHGLGDDLRMLDWERVELFDCRVQGGDIHVADFLSLVNTRLRTQLAGVSSAAALSSAEALAGYPYKKQ